MGNRVKQVSLKEVSPEILPIYQRMFGDRDPVAEPGTRTGTRGDYHTSLALAPDLFKLAFEMLLKLLSPGRSLDPVLRELAILRTAIAGDCRFEYSQHLKTGREAGVPEEKLQAIKGWMTSDIYNPAERAAMAAADELVTRNLVEDQTFAALKKHLNDEQIVELFFAIATYRMHGMMVRALHLEHDDDTTARMQEVPAPSARAD
jgi:AhpD family alkylhydroperoxidase